MKSALAAFVLALAVTMIVPLPAWLLDLLLASNLECVVGRRLGGTAPGLETRGGRGSCLRGPVGHHFTLPSYLLRQGIVIRQGGQQGRPPT